MSMINRTLVMPIPVRVREHMIVVSSREPFSLTHTISLSFGDAPTKPPTHEACDVLARFMRLSGRPVCFVTGTDEHGQKVEQSAAKQGVPPQAFVDAVSTNFRDLLTTLNIQNDLFIRTTQPDHKAAVQHLWNVLSEKGYIYKGNYEGWYSVRDECFYTETELVDGKAPTGAEVEWVAKEESYFFKLSAFQEKLLEHYEANPWFIAPDGRRNEVLSFVRGGLRDLSISRTSFQWGVPVPDDPAHVVYVWIDALTNYLSALGYPEDPTKNVATFWPCALHVVGKDILRFHAVYWPAMLMAADLPLPQRIFAHGWWTKDGQKISKSIGNVIDPLQLVEKVRLAFVISSCVYMLLVFLTVLLCQYGVDPTRFFLMSEVNFGNDGDFSDRAMVFKVNSNLANELGNLCQRTLSMVHKNCNAAVPTTVGPYTDADLALWKSVEGLWSRAATAISTQAIHKYVEVLVQQIVDTNKYIDDMAPWVLRKTDPERMATVLYVIMEVLRYTAILYQPLIPESASKILDQLSVPANERTFVHLSDKYRIPPGTPITKPEGIFPRIELPSSEDVVQQIATAI
jgi:methionyl-tRNA synthetase